MHLPSGVLLIHLELCGELNALASPDLIILLRAFPEHHERPALRAVRPEASQCETNRDRVDAAVLAKRLPFLTDLAGHKYLSGKVRLVNLR